MNGGWKLRREWKWDERYLTRTRWGERKRRGKEQTHTNTPSPERANPEKAREKKKAEGRRTRTKTSGGGGKTEAPEPTCHSENLPKNLSTRRSQPTWGGKRAWDRGPMGNKLVKNKNKTRIQLLKPRSRALCHSRPVFRSATIGINGFQVPAN